MTEHFVSVLEYARLKEFLIKTHPGDLNHDLDKLIKDALIRAVGFIKRLYLDRLKEEHALTLWQKFSRPFASLLSNFGVTHALKSPSGWLIKPVQFTVASVLRFFDALFKVMRPKVGPHGKLNETEITTIAIMADSAFYGN